MSMSVLMPVSEPVRRLELFTGEGRRRSWSAEEKAAIVAESYAGGESVCGVARRHGLTSQQLFTWRRLARQPLPSVEGPPALFVPAVVELSAPEAPPSPRPPRARRRRPAAGIELEVGGVVVRVGAGASEAQIAAVIRALKAGA